MSDSDDKRNKVMKKSTPGMNFVSYSNCLSDLTKYFNEFLTTDNKDDKTEKRKF